MGKGGRSDNVLVVWEALYTLKEKTEMNECWNDAVKTATEMKVAALKVV